MPFDVPENLDLPNDSPSLPPVFFWQKGDKQLKNVASENSVLYTGGWVTTSSEGDEFGLDEEVFTNTSGNEYTGYSSRFIKVMPIYSKLVWRVYNEDTGLFTYNSHYVQGSRSLRYDLVLVSLPGKEPFPALLKTTGMQSKYIGLAMRKWSADSKKIRGKAGKANDVTLLPNYFWIDIGSSENPEFIVVGHGQKTNIITPISLLTPSPTTVKELGALYVGKDVLLFASDVYNSSEITEFFNRLGTNNNNEEKADNAEEITNAVIPNNESNESDVTDDFSDLF